MGLKRHAFNYRTYLIAFTLLIVVSALSFFLSEGGGDKFAPLSRKSAFGQDIDVPAKKWKILHVMSYHLPWVWNVDQFNGFKDGLGGLDVEYKVFQMDTKRRSSKQWKEKVGREARELIETWKPDLVYANDDDAQEYVTKYYINKDIPFVFSGVNGDPEEYGFVGAKNITGVLEEEHFIETVKLLKEIVPEVKKIAIVMDDGPTWPPVVERIKQKMNQIPDVELTSCDVIYTFAGFKRKIKDYHSKVDAVGLLGIFTYKDESGNNVDYTEVLKWTAANSRLPDFSFWKSRIPFGTLCAVNASGYEQGLAAGKIARGILVEGRSPSSYAMKPTVRGEPVISLARAKKLGIKIKAKILLSSQVFTKFAWEK